MWLFSREGRGYGPELLMSQAHSSENYVTAASPMTPFLFKSDNTSHLAAQWPEVWEPLRIEFIRFCHECATNLGTPPIVITCLSRTPIENSAVGGRPTSLHLARPCRAIDIRRRGFDQYSEHMKSHWQSRGVGWDFVIEGPPFNRKPLHFHLEADWRVV